MEHGTDFPGRDDLGAEALRALGHEAIDWIADYLASFRPDAPILPPETPQAIAAALDEPLPEEGAPPAAVLAAFRERIAARATHLQHPGNFAYVPNSASMIGVVADALASALNQNVSLVRGGPSAAAVEALVVRWLRDGLGYPAEGGGVLTSGGSMANLLGLALARHRLEDRGDLVVYVSSETHSSIEKGLRFLGVPAERLRVVAADDAYRLRADALAEAIRRDRAAGLRPGIVVATAGTIASGAVDPLEELADLCRTESLWLHVDGAYGALAAWAPTGAWMRAGLGRADSLSLDPHKWLFVPIDTSCLLVREPRALRSFLAVVPDYLKVSGAEASGAIHHPMEHTVELTRRFRALRLWMTIKVVGARWLRERIDAHLKMAAELAARIDDDARYELLAPVMTSTVCFRRLWPGLAPEEIDRRNEELMDRVNAAPRGLFLSRARLSGRFALRVCITHLRTRPADVERLWRALGELGDGLA